MFKMLVCPLLLLSINLPFLQMNANAQINNTTDKKDNEYKLVIDSAPRDAYVEISGKYSFVGRTPFTLPYKLYGKYTITAKKDGYETYSAKINLTQRGANLITLRLDKKTKFRASYRSFFLPSWGQFYGQGKLKGFFVGFTQVSLAVSTLLVLDKYDQRKKEYNLALDNFKQISFNFEEADLAFRQVEKKYKTAKDLQDLRNIIVSATVGFWVYNILDSVIFFSSHKKRNGTSVWHRPKLSGQVLRDQVWVSMNFRF